MAWSKTTLISSFAVLGFLLGTISYSVFNWFASNNMIYIATIPLSDLILSPGFVSGVIGSLIAVLAMYVYAHFSKGE